MSLEFLTNAAPSTTLILSDSAPDLSSPQIAVKVDGTEILQEDDDERPDAPSPWSGGRGEGASSALASPLGMRPGSASSGRVRVSWAPEVDNNAENEPSLAYDDDASLPMHDSSPLKATPLEVSTESINSDIGAEISSFTPSYAQTQEVTLSPTSGEEVDAVVADNGVAQYDEDEDGWEDEEEADEQESSSTLRGVDIGAGAEADVDHENDRRTDGVQDEDINVSYAGDESYSDNEEVESDADGLFDEFEDDEDLAETEGEDDEEDEEEASGYAEESKNLLDLLYSIAEDQARKGFRFKCANCVDFDLCEGCEAADVHPRTHIFLKIRIPIPPHANPRSALLPVFYPGKAIEDTEFQKIEFRELAEKTHFDVVELHAFYEQFRSLATVEPGGENPAGITREVFEQCLGPLGLEKNLITERIFAFFDQDKDKLISFPELVYGLSILCKGSLDERIKYAFQGYDIDGDGVISREELHRMFKAYFYLSMELVRDYVKTMEEGMMETFDDEASKPVSASFAAPSMHGQGDPTHEEDDNVKEDPGVGTSSGASTAANARRKGKRPASAHESDFSGSILLGATYAPPPSATSPGILTRAYRVGSITTNGLPTPGGPNSTGFGSFDLPPSPISAMSPGFDDLALAHSATATTPGGDGEEQWPIIEAMGQDAIEEMVEKTFIAAGALSHDFITEEEFKKAVEADNSYLQWFEALGSVF
ncbi:hypothetical protein HDU96_005447 [Phlyctochytrium bullatum]|nr:hypothetical protein HDU96_005447 [Phlyctochytrium bullatum]